ncbi:MAG TPA: alkaline phosphatase D family protein [Solirubrobacteraceae bacterium]|nr:alkaline phosphatase D family protein [Solirubrobacteraceae bacterium]
MPLRLAVSLLIAAACAAVPAGASAKGFRLGVTAAEASTTSALVWTRADRAGFVTLEVARDRRFSGTVVRRRMRAAARTDKTVQARLRGLTPGDRYFYRFTRPGARSDRGEFETAPRPSSTQPVTFAWTGDSDPVKRPGTNRLVNSPFDVFARMARQRNDFNVNLGDTIYSDSDSEFDRQDPLALSVAQKRAKYRDVLSDAALRRARASTSMYNHWDDHEFINDFAIAQTGYRTRSGAPEGLTRVVTVDGSKLYRDGVKAFREYMPVTYSRSSGIYRSFRWGRNLEVFLLDERSFRDAGADDGGVCDNPAGSGSRDLAPTAPQRTRALFAFLVPALGTPPPPACVARINDPNRTLLGARQFNRFTRAIERSTATFKVIMNELPIQQFYADPYDRWEGYEAERQRMIATLRDRVKNVVFLAADVHGTLANDVRLRTLEDGGPQNSGILEVTTGPSGTDTFKDDLNDTSGNPQAGDLINSAFFTRQPPDGPGVQCSALDTFSFGQVKVTGRTLSIVPRDANGRVVTGHDGNPCGPYVVTRR